MKKLLLAVSVSAALSGTVFSEDLTFDSASALAGVQTCAASDSPLSCGDATQDFAIEA